MKNEKWHMGCGKRKKGKKKCKMKNGCAEK